MSDRMKPVNLAELHAQFKDSRFGELIHHHLNRQSQDQRLLGIQETLLMLPAEARDLAEAFIDRWNARAHDESFWRTDTAQVLDEIIADARNVLRGVGLDADDDAAFNMFNVVVLNYTRNAYDQPEMRQIIGLESSRFPWPSALSLLYPISATIYIATWTPASPTMIVGYGLANLGYLLFGAAMTVGSFRVLGLRKRWQLFAAALLAFASGTVLSNISI